MPTKRRLVCDELVVGEREGWCLQSYDTWRACWRGAPNLAVILTAHAEATHLIFYDGKNRERLRLGIEEEGSPYIVMKDARGKEIWRAPTRKGRGKNVVPLRVLRPQKQSEE